MSEKYTINSEYDICFDGKVYIANKNLNSLCYIQLFCRLLNEDEKRKSAPKNINIKQINIIPVQNTCTTQCYAYMYALDNEGILWFKRDNDIKWTKESLECK